MVTATRDHLVPCLLPLVLLRLGLRPGILVGFGAKFIFQGGLESNKALITKHFIINKSRLQTFGFLFDCKLQFLT